MFGTSLPFENKDTLNYFRRFCADLPEKLRGASADCLENVRKAAEEVGRSEAQKAQVLFVETLKKSTEEITGNRMILDGPHKKAT